MSGYAGWSSPAAWPAAASPDTVSSEPSSPSRSAPGVMPPRPKNKRSFDEMRQDAKQAMDDDDKQRSFIFSDVPAANPILITKRQKVDPATQRRSSPQVPAADMDIDAEIEAMEKSMMFLDINRETKRLVDVYKEEEERKLRDRRGLSVQEQIESKIEARKYRSTGDLRLKDFFVYVGTFNMYRFAPQMLVIRKAAASLIVQMFGDTLDEHIERLKHQYGYTDNDIRKGVICVIMPRRRGKSEVVAAIEAAAALSIGKTSAVFAAYSRQAIELMQLIYNRICEIDPTFVIVKNAQKMVVSKLRSENDPDKCTIRCFSGNADSARGFKADRIHFDEASFAKPEFITRNVFAGMTMKNVVVFLISSPPKKVDNTFAQLVEMKNDYGEEVFKVVYIRSKCAECTKLRDDKPGCPHVISPTPPWMANEDQMETIRNVLKRLDPLAYDQEILGIMSGQDIPVMPENVIQKIKVTKKISFKEPPETILIGFDPAGADRSELAFCAATLLPDGETFVILGMETKRMIDIDIAQSTIEFVERIWKNVGKKRSRLVVFGESNYGGPAASQSCYKAIRAWAVEKQCHNISFLCEDTPDAKGRPGFWLSHQKKEMMAYWIRSLANNNQLRFGSTVESQNADVMTTFYEQARNYVRRSTRRSSGRNMDSSGALDQLMSYEFTGKSGGHNDDLFVIVQEVCWLLHRMNEGDMHLSYQNVHGVSIEKAARYMDFVRGGEELGDRSITLDDIRERAVRLRY